MRPASRFAWLAGLALIMGACATAPSKPGLSPDTPATSLLEDLAASRRAKAEALERTGHLRRALEQWKIALTIDPGDAVAREERRRLEGRIERAVADRLSQGRKALERGAHREARRHFLAALALDPANRVAFHVLQREVSAVRTVTPTVPPGTTTLTAVAEQWPEEAARAEIDRSECLPTALPNCEEK